MNLSRHAAHHLLQNYASVYCSLGTIIRSADFAVPQEPELLNFGWKWDTFPTSKMKSF